jgi:hypothetical protein
MPCKKVCFRILTRTDYPCSHRHAYRAGVVTAISAPLHNGFLGGLSTAFSLGAAHKLEEGAIKREIVALHITLGHGFTPSVSTEIAALRTLILHPPNGEAEYWIRQLTKVCCVTYKPGCEIGFINFSVAG